MDEESISRFWRKPSETMSESRSGSMMVDRADWIWDCQSDGCFVEDEPSSDDDDVSVLGSEEDALSDSSDDAPCRMEDCCTTCACWVMALDCDAYDLGRTRADLGINPDTAPARAEMSNVVLMIAKMIWYSISFWPV